MSLLYKQINKELLKNKSMIAILLLFVILTSFMYFFVHFSIDYNIQIYSSETLEKLNMASDAGKYYIALKNNLGLIRNITVALAGIISFVIFLFFKNFIRKNENDIGNFMTMGFSTNSIILAFVRFVVVLSVTGSAIGLLLGYFSSDILIQANTKTYLVNGIIKGIHLSTLLKGTLLLPVVYSVATYITCMEIDKKEVALKIKKGYTHKKPTFISKAVDKIVNVLPFKEKFKFRIALRNVNSLLLLLMAIVTFNIMFILSVSLFFSSGKIYESQTLNHNYKYNISYDDILHNESNSNDIFYLKNSGEIIVNDNKIEYNIVGLDKTNELFRLVDKNNNTIESDNNDIILNPELSENYNISVGDSIVLSINNELIDLKVSSIADNAHLKTIYISKDLLAGIMGVNNNAYNGILSNASYEGGTVITTDEKLEALERSSTSNKASAVINQSIGITIGCLLIFLAILIALNNNIQSILIFDLLGYKNSEINKILLNSFFIIVNFLFLITFLPSAYFAKGIQIMTSIQTNDYMPFQMNIFTVLYLFLLINVIYFSVRSLFSRKIKSIINSERQNEIIM